MPLGKSTKSDVSVSPNLGFGTEGFSVTPQVQIGSGENAEAGGKIGGAVGTAAGSFFGGPAGAAAGSAAGSALGSGIGGLFDEKRGSEEHGNRNSVRSAFSDLGIWDSGNTFLLPDGSTANFSLDSHEGLHEWKYGDKRVDKEGDRQLFAYETDYTNDLDYVAGMGGITLSRLLGGEKGKSVDQVGQLIGNQSLGTVGFGGELSQQNFSTVMNNLRSQYSKAGVQNKEEFLSLANKMFADTRINDADYAVMLQTGNMVYDNDYNLAQQLMAGRWNGIKTASKTPSRQNRPGRIYSPLISPDEALMSVQPYVDVYNQSRERAARGRTNQSAQVQADIASGVALASGIYSIGNKVTEGALGTAISDVGSGLIEGAEDLVSGAADLVSDFF